jgi:hypothetical protein
LSLFDSMHFKLLIAHLQENQLSLLLIQSQFYAQKVQKYVATKFCIKSIVSRKSSLCSSSSSSSSEEAPSIQWRVPTQLVAPGTRSLVMHLTSSSFDNNGLIDQFALVALVDQLLWFCESLSVREL